MSESKFQPGDFVWFRNKGVGRVKEGGVRPEVIFWADKDSGDAEEIPSGLLTSLADNSPEAMLWQRPKELETWAKERPLQLVALALSVEGGTGKASDIKEKLDGRLSLGSKYTTWWGRTRPKINLPEPQKHFKVDKNAFVLLSRVGEVPPDADLATFLLSEWNYWLSNETSTPPPWSRWPKGEVFAALDNALEQLRDIDAEQALIIVINGAEEFLGSVKTPKPVATNWLETLGRTFLRWRDRTGTDSYSNRTAQVIRILARLCEIVGYAKSGQQWLLLAHDDDSWQQGVAAGMWAASKGASDRARRRSLFQTASELLGRQGRADLAREIALSTLRVEYTPPRYSEVDLYLQDLNGSEDTVQHLYELIALAAATEASDKVLDYIANSRHASGPENFSLRLMAALTLTKGRGEFAARTSRELADALEALGGYGPEVQAVLKDTVASVEKAIAEKDRKMAEQRKEHEAELERERQERERLREQVRERNSELSANRRESRLEVMQDTLQLAGEVFQCVPLWTTLEEAIRDSEAGLARALRAGGAELLETATAMVEYDPLRHHAKARIPKGCWVKVVAPGVIYRGGIHGDRVLLKAQVKHEAG